MLPRTRAPGLSRAARPAAWLGFAGVVLLAGWASGARAACPSLLEHSIAPLQGGEVRSLCEYAGRVVLVVNTASQCGHTPQYDGLEKLYDQYRARGLVVLGFPSNDFGGQEPGSDEQIAEFCRTQYGIRFPMMSKSSVVGPAANGFYQALAARSGQAPQWNFHKYLISRDGAEVLSFASRVRPEDRALAAAVERMLGPP